MVLYTLYIMIGLAFTSTIIELVRWGNLQGNWEQQPRFGDNVKLDIHIRLESARVESVKN